MSGVVHEFRYQSLFVRGCQYLDVRGFQTIILFVKDVGMFFSGPVYFVCQRAVLFMCFRISSGPVYFVRGFQCWRFSSCTICLSEVSVSKGFFGYYFFCFCFCGFTVYVRGFFRFSMFVRVWGVRRLLQVYCFGVSEVSRLECQRISSGLGLQFQVWVSNDFKVYLTEDFCRASV